ncbi:MAG: cytochrome b/b6 domain-containing protein [Gammaproteobacteria bacterium]|nr:cytochrome b/b6 domain-containing protein [Gammaproteobacteria bacterium]
MATQTVKVWDFFVRFFHWALVLFFIVAFASGEEWATLHAYAGYAIGGLLALRLVWGLVGSRYARFSNFVQSRQTVKAYLNDVLHFRGKRYIGHNPLGGWMIVAMLLTLVLTTLTGLVAYGGTEHAGPLVFQAQALPAVVLDAIEELHEGLANFTLLLVLIHVAGVAFESLVHGENLVSAMITGRKQL